MKTFFSLATLTLGVSNAFNVGIQRRTPRSVLQNDKEGNEIAVSSTFRDIAIDMDKVKDCTEHFGKCSVEEIEELKNDLHDRRIQNLVFGDSAPLEDIFEEKLFEEELSLQLSLLEKEAPESYLFPEVEEEVMDDLPHPPTKDETVAASVKNSLDKQKSFFLLEELAEEGVLESLAICGLLGMMTMFGPHDIAFQ